MQSIFSIKSLALIIPVALGLTMSAKADAGELTANQIVNRTNNTSYYQGKDGRSKVKMTITGKSGSKRVREFTVLRRNQGKAGGDQSFYLYFHKPADVSKMVFVAQKHVGKSDDRWLYLPSLDLVKRIGASDKRTSFVGSDFYYEDISGRGLNEDTHTLVETSSSYYVLKHTPKKPGTVEFASYKMWIHKKTFLPTKVEYYNQKGKKYREMTVDSVKTIQGFKTVTKATMTSLDAGTSTTVEYSQVKYNLDLPENLFGERYLRRAPQKYLK